MTTINRTVREHIKQVVETERTKTVRVLTHLRAVVVAIYAGQTIYFGAVQGEPDSLVTIPIFIPYCLVAVLLSVLVERLPSTLRWSSLAVAILDIPMMTLAAFVAIPLVPAPNPPHILLPSLLPFLSGAIVLGALSLDYRVIAITSVAGAIAGAVFTAATGTSWGISADPFQANLAIGALCAFVVSRIRSLVEESRRKDFAGKYVLGERLGRGGMAEVFRATYSPAGGFEREVAVKRVLPSYADDAQFVALFRREAELGAQLAHPNLVQVLDFGRHLDSWFMAMELVEGRTLASLLADRQPMSMSAALYVIAEVAEALTYLQEKRSADGTSVGLVHRDLNPPNVLISMKGEVKVSDLGVARWTTGAPQLTEAGTVRGKLTYMPPEYLAGGQPSPEGDLYALGVMLHEVLTGRRMHEGLSDAAVAQKVLTGTPQPPSVDNPSIPPVLDALVLELLSRQPSDRPRARDVVRRLRLLDPALAPYPDGRDALISLIRDRTPAALALPNQQESKPDTDRTGTLPTRTPDR